MTTITISAELIAKATRLLDKLDPDMVFTASFAGEVSGVVLLLKDALSAPATAPAMTEIDYNDDNALRFVQRVLESEAPESDRKAALEMVVAIRTRVLKARASKPATAPEQQKKLDLSVFRMSWDYELSAMRKDQSGPYVCFSDLAYMLPATAPEQCGHCGRRVIDAPWPVRDTTPEQPAWQDAPTEPGMWACLYMGELSTAIFNAYEIEHFDRDEMVGCRWRFIPEDKQ